MKNFLKGSVAGVVLVAILAAVLLVGCGVKADDFIQPQYSSDNLIKGAEIVSETLKKGEKADAKNILKDDSKNWTPRYVDGKPKGDNQNILNSAVEIKLTEEKTFNTAVIKEIGNEVQYFRLQAWIGGRWENIYQSEKIQTMRLCSFDAVTTDRIRLSIDKFRSDKAAKINCIELYNETKRNAGNFNVTAYQRLDFDVPSEILTRSEKEINDYAKFYDVYNCILIFGAIGWDGDTMVFNVPDGEAGFDRELKALKEIISRRTNTERDVKIICTTLPDGTGGGHVEVNAFMEKHWETLADKMVEFMKKYELDGLDIDWEFPQNKNDWKCYDKFITRLDDGMTAYKSDAILSGALAAWNLGMSEEVLERFNQIQYMAYDGNDKDGYQSSLQQAQEGLKDFVDKGADLSRINIGIAVYGRPTNGATYWPIWRDQNEKDMYWNSMYYNVVCGGELFDAAFCAPALAGDKTTYALLCGAGGVMAFRLDCDKINDPNSVTSGIKNALDRYTFM